MAFLPGILYIALLQSCLNTIVQRHEILRTAFVAVNGQPNQVIIPELLLALPIIDLRTVPELTRQIEVEKLTKTRSSVSPSI